MVKSFASLLICCALLAPLSATAKEFVVRKIIDGNTIQLETGEIVRYIGTETPALSLKTGGSEFFAKEASKYNQKLVLLKKVRLEFDKEQKDSEGKTLAYVFVKKVFINAEMIKLGYARARNVHPNEKYKSLFADEEARAIRSERGLWQEKKKDTEASYLGNKRSYTLHRPSCKLVDKIPEKNRIVFRNRSDAIKIGYIPDKVCKP